MRCVSITVGAKAIDAVVAFEQVEPLRTSSFPGLPARAISLMPGLRGHRCDNGEGLTFVEELADTEIAHLLEHVTVELMALSGSPDTLAGRTVWDFAADGRGVFHVRIEYDDDLVAIGALSEASAIVDRLCALDARPDAPDPDIHAVVAGLRVVRRR